ncbi:MAG: hypothetical protein K1X75_12175 [Leptospirales bacterium]|nr:hypothetical protein [Leptospirales bacterium]
MDTPSNGMPSWVGGALIVGILVVSLLISAALLLPYYFMYRRIPAQYLRMPAWSALLLMIPCAGIIFYWILIPFQTPDALRAWIAETNPESLPPADDLGRGIGIGAAVTMSMGWVPYLNICTSIAFIVLHIIYLVKLNDYLKLGREPAATHDLGLPPLDPNNPYGRI